MAREKTMKNVSRSCGAALLSECRFLDSRMSRADRGIGLMLASAYLEETCLNNCGFICCVFRRPLLSDDGEVASGCSEAHETPPQGVVALK